MKKILITGGNGFIGSNLSRHFLERGWEVLALVRESSDLHFLRGLGVRLIKGDLSDPDKITIPGDTSFVIHTAALVSDNAGDEDCKRQIYQLTRNLVDRLRFSAVPLRRFIYMSTALTIGFNGQAISEENPGESAEKLPYARYKTLTEKYLLEEHALRGFPVVILRPGDVYGPNDRVTCANILKGCERGVPLIAGSGRWRFGFCYVGNLCRATEAALLKEGIEGRAYTVTNGRLPTWREFFQALQRGLGRKQRVRVPVWLAFALASVMEFFGKMIPGYSPTLNRYRIKRITTETTYDISRTIAELGYEPDDDFDRQFAEIVAWYLREKQDGYFD